MLKNLLQAYALLSCLIFSIITFVVLGESINHATFYFFPELGDHNLPHELETTQDYIEFRKNSEILYAELKKLPPEAIEQRRKQEIESWERREIHKIKTLNLQNLIKKFPWVILSLVLLCTHVIVYKRCKHEAIPNS